MDFPSRKIEKNQYISLDEFIKRAKVLGVDFGRGNPKNRLRYYVKLGLLPHVERKVFEGNLPTGAYPLWVLERLVEIDKKLKEGKSIAQIKRELEKKEFLEEKQAKEKKPEIQSSLAKKTQKEKEEFQRKIPSFSILNFKKKAIFYFLSNFAIVLLFLFFGSKLFQFFHLPSLLATLFQEKRFAQLESQRFTSPDLLSFFREPYLTINAQTAIKNQLSVTGNLLVGENLEVEEEIRGKTFLLKGREYSGKITLGELTENREYIFPDASGIICLSTGNCIGLAGEVTTPGGTASRLAKFIGERRIGNSSIQDLFGGISLTIDARGNVGIGTQTPTSKLEIAGNLRATGLNIRGDSFFEGKTNFSGDVLINGNISLRGNLALSGNLDVTGKIHATGDICTDEGGGKCLSQLITWFFGGGGGVAGSGQANFLPIWLAGNRLGQSIIFQDGNLVSIAGTLRVNEFYLPTGAAPGKFLMALDNTGKAIWYDLTATLPGGQENQTIRYGKTGWEATSFLWNTGSQLGIGTTSPTAMLTLAGDFDLRGPLKITDFLSHYLKLALNQNDALIESTKKIVINSLTGEVFLGNNVSLFDASNAQIKALTFISAPDDATVRKKGEKILRAVIPIFKYSIPSQTNSTTFQDVSKSFSPSLLGSLIPTQLPGTERKFAFLINFADNIPQNSSSTWQIDFENQPDLEFQFRGQNLSSLNEGFPFFKDNILGLSSDNWVLKTKVPNSQYELRVFNALLLVYDEVK